MFIKLFLIFTLIPITELALLIEVGRIIGLKATILLILFTGFMGAFLARQQGLEVLERLQQTVRRGEYPSEHLLDGLLIFIAGAVLLTPGVITDLFGFLLLFPPSRFMVKQFLRAKIQKWIDSKTVVKDNSTIKDDRTTIEIDRNEYYHLDDDKE